MRWKVSIALFYLTVHAAFRLSFSSPLSPFAFSFTLVYIHKQTTHAHATYLQTTAPEAAGIKVEEEECGKI